MKSRILVVDDDLLVRSALRRTLRDHFQVDMADSGAAAIASLEANRYAAVISDLKMPCMDGLSLLKWVARNQPETGRILLTGHADFQLTVGAVTAADIFKILHKPWDNAELIAILYAAIGREKIK